MSRRSKNLGRAAVCVAVLAALTITAGSVASARGRRAVPVVVTNQENPDQQEIFQDSLTVLQFDPLRASSECMPALPEGKRLVIEHVSARVRLPEGQQGYVAIKTHPLHLASMIPLTPQMTHLGHTTYAGAVSLRVRVEAPNLPCFLVERNDGAGQGTALFTVSGYLVDIVQ